MSNNFNYDGVIIRHEPDGKLIAVLTKPYHTVDDLADLLKKYIPYSNNFRVEGFHMSKTHEDFVNFINLYYNSRPEDQTRIQNKEIL